MGEFQSSGVSSEQPERETAGRKETERRLALFQRFVEASAEGMGWTDLDGLVRYVNPALCQMLGEERPKHTYGKPIGDYYSEKVRERFREEIFPTILKKGVWTGDLTLRSGKGTTTPTANSFFILRDAQGTPIGFANVVTDLTQRKRTEDELIRHRDHLAELVAGRTQELRAANRELEQEVAVRKRAERILQSTIAELEAQNAELDRFTYTVTHDLKSPLITIKGFSGVLKDDLGAGNARAVEDDLRRIGNAADKMAQLLDELLKLSRIGRLVNPPQNVDLGELALEVVELRRDRIEKRGVAVEIASGMPVVFGDRPRLLEMMRNLIDNAIKYLGEEPCPRVEIGHRQEGNETICYICDNGIGIESAQHANIFGLFEQIDPKNEGTGVGLSVVKRIVEVHGGRVWVESEGRGQGTSFCFTMPTGGDIRSFRRTE